MDYFDPKIHEWVGDGWRHHVISWALVYINWNTKTTIQICSEKDCEINVREQARIKNLKRGIK